MFTSLFAFSISAILPFIIILFSFIIAARSSSDREKSSPFECGFDPKKTARIPFSLRFFLLAVIFLVFDIEIILLMPTPIILASAQPLTFIMTSFLFIMILMVGLLHEWREGSLNWSY
uniref:NADH-ubiquinone oxidoreductase chain 3 n=1 Tax=Aphrodita australis TaxID=2715517 RepID=A0A6G7IY20_9ANNE|nr:NADH dehydrogenase subunit 3 [Aphrodita australis]QII43123.1 NADH dehydrogenase subunit 3 [Aphrodita australis]